MSKSVHIQDFPKCEIAINISVFIFWCMYITIQWSYLIKRRARYLFSRPIFGSQTTEGGSTIDSILPCDAGVHVRCSSIQSWNNHIHVCHGNGKCPKGKCIHPST